MASRPTTTQAPTATEFLDYPRLARHAKKEMIGIQFNRLRHPIVIASMQH